MSTSLTQTEIQQLLGKKDRWVALTTLGPDGYPHTVPIGYFLTDGRLVMGCRDGTQKVKNIERNDRVSVLWENGRGQDALIGILFQGRARVVRDDQERWDLKVEACRQRGEDPPGRPVPGSVYIEITPTKTISWNRPLSR